MALSKFTGDGQAKSGSAFARRSGERLKEVRTRPIRKPRAIVNQG